MRENIKKIFRDDFIFYIFMIIVLVIGWLLPKTGAFVLVDELFEILFVCLVAALVIFTILRMDKANSHIQKVGRIAIIIAALAIVIFFSKNLMIDVIGGTQRTGVEHVEVSRQQGRFGIISMRYYISGVDKEGNRVRFEISGNDYSRLLDKKSVTVEYYESTKRVVSVN